MYQQVSWSSSIMWSLHQSGQNTLYLVVRPQWVCSLVDTAAFFQPPLPNLGIFSFGKIAGIVPSLHSKEKPVAALSTSHLPPPPSQMQTASVTHQPGSFLLNFCASRRLKSGFAVDVQFTQGLVRTVFHVFDMLIYPTCCMPSYSFCCVFLSAKVL